MMRFCTKCGAQNEEDAVFCTACGAALKQKKQKAAAAKQSRTAAPPQDGGISLRKRPFPRAGFIAAAAAVVVLLAVIFWVATAKECDRCGKTYHGSGYYDSLDTNTVMCEDCAREYYAPFDYKAFRK